MKMSKSFSLDSDRLSEFLSECEMAGFSPNAVLDAEIKEWLADRKAMEYKMITCKECGAKYSNKLNFCPACEEQKLKNKELLEQKVAESEKAKKMEMLTIDLINLNQRKEYLSAHLAAGHAQQWEMDEVVQQIKEKEKEIECLKSLTI